MIVGDPARFAIESEITFAYERPSFRALGCFLIHVGGRSFGVRAPDASMLACSFDAVGRRLARRGCHVSAFAGADALAFARCYRAAFLGRRCTAPEFEGLSADTILHDLRVGNIVWAPDGDEAFDDSSYVLQFDARNEVRLIAFTCLEDGGVDAASLRSTRLAADEFYEILAGWLSSFESEWRATTKTPELCQ
jgi:hypothetical protein